MSAAIDNMSAATRAFSNDLNVVAYIDGVSR
jgi:hypothetical protein